ncbi:MAG: hypothetical protein WAL23_08580 [Nitrososphaeraceae archaeon]
MKNSRMHSLTLAAILIGAVGSTSILFASTLQFSNAQEETVARDSQLILLEGKTLPAKDFIHLYDTTPYMIKVGHVAAKLPCDSKFETPLKVLIGQAPKLNASELELVKELSTPGKMCIYHVDVKSDPVGINPTTITDIALQNPTDNEVKFGPTATVVIGVDGIMPLKQPAQSMGNMSMGNSTG